MNFKKYTSGDQNTFPKALNSFFAYFKSNEVIVQNSSSNTIMKSRVNEKSATTTMGKPKKKRPSIFAFFSRKKKADKVPVEEMTGPSVAVVEPHPEDLISDVGESVPIPAAKSKKKFPAPPPPDDANKENYAAYVAQKRPSVASSVSKFSRQGSRRSSRNYKRKQININSKEITAPKTKSGSISSSSAVTPPEINWGERGNSVSQFTPGLLVVGGKDTIHVLQKEVEFITTKLEIDATISQILTKTKGITPVKESQLELEDLPPAIPESSPPELVVATNLSFVSTKSAVPSIQRLSNFGLNPSKLPPIPVSTFEELTDTASETSSICTMPIYTSMDLKQRLQTEHKKLLELFDEWEMIRKPLLIHQKSDKLPDNSSHLIDAVMSKQEALLRQHAMVSSLYQQLLAPVTSTNSSPTLTAKSKPPTSKHIIGTEKYTSPAVRSVLPPMFRSQSTANVNGDNNNVKTEPQRNFPIAGSYSPRISHAKRYSLGDALNTRPRLGGKETSFDETNGLEKSRKYYVEPNKPIVRNIPILPASPKLTDVKSPSPIYNEHKSYNGKDDQKWKSHRITESPKEYRIPIKTIQAEQREPVATYHFNNALNQNKKIHVNDVNNVPVVKKQIQESPKMLPKHNQHEIYPQVVKKQHHIESSPQMLRNQKQVEKSPQMMQKQHYVESSPKMVRKQQVENSPQLARNQHHIENSPVMVRKPPSPAKSVDIESVINKPGMKFEFGKEQESKESRPKITTKSPNVSKPTAASPVSAPNLPNAINSLRRVPKPVEKSFNVGRVLEDHEVRATERTITQSFDNVQKSNGHIPPPPPPPPSNFVPPPPPPPMIKQNKAPKSSPVDQDALRGDMLAEIRNAGGIGFLRSKNR
uniref:WH2 domain-containing protein n=1 Tax=Panagrolaimus sp. JU765 TaxID=591449 RepID=A0AC34RIT8_9BILA